MNFFCERKSNMSELPAPSLNGGLYTGEPFLKNAPWANVPVLPDASYMIHYNLRSANPPPGAIYHYPGGQRPGNNTTVMYGVGIGAPAYNQSMIREGIKEPAPCSCYKCSYFKYSYLTK